jgi:TfoX/Sxy family transcriptional regulator of competence genes
MFGEYTIYCNDKVVALVCDDQLFVKITEAGRALLQSADEAPAYPGAKPSFHIDGEVWDDREFLTQLIKATADELPVPKRK